MIKIDSTQQRRISQGGIFSDVEYIESADEKEGIIEVNKIVFPRIIILTQDCDLEHDFVNREEETDNDDKILLSAIVAPLYNVEHVYNGEHLEYLGRKMRIIERRPKKTENKYLKQNQISRYHYLEFPEDANIVPSVIDFKHYFTVNLLYLMAIKDTNFVCKVGKLYRERISQRFANFLARIGLPNQQ